MTVHARGYRRHEGGTERPRLRFLPIVAEGYRAGTRGKAFRRLGLLFVVIVVFHGVMLYLDPAALFPRRMRGGLGQVTSDDLMRRVLAFFARSLAGLVPLVAMFVGAGFWAFRPGSRQVQDEAAGAIFRNEDRPAPDTNPTSTSEAR